MDQNIYDYKDIYHILHTTSDRNTLNLLIDSVRKSAFRTDTTAFQSALQNAIKIDQAEALQNAIKRNNIDSTSPTQLETFLRALQVQLGAFKIFTITIPIEPTQHFIEILYSWTSEQYGKDLLLDIQQDKKIVAGIKVMFEGKYKDISVEKFLNTFLAQHMDKIALLLK